MSLQRLRKLDFSAFIKFSENWVAVCSILLVDFLGFTKKINYMGISWESQTRIIKNREGLKKGSFSCILLYEYKKGWSLNSSHHSAIQPSSPSLITIPKIWK
jgi:hypothetical protein